MGEKKMRKLLSFILIALLTLSMFVGCSPEGPADTPAKTPPASEGSEDPPEASDGNYTIGISMDDLNTEFWKANLEGMRSRAAEKNVTLVEVVANGDANKQNEQISDLIAQGVDAIICAANDGSAIGAAIGESKAAGIPFIMDNRPVQGDIKPDAQILSDSFQMSYDEMVWFIEHAKENNLKFENAVMLIGDLGDENAIHRYEGYSKAIEDNPGFVNIAVEIPTEWSHEVALAGLQNALQANPNIDLIILPSDFLWTPVQSALEQVGKWAPIGEENHVAAISFDGDANGMQMMKDGYNWAVAAQAAVATGETCIDQAIYFIEGGEPLEDIDVIDPGIICTLDNFDEVKEDVWGWPGVK
jgi:ABC-type sugar transport system substrate-binding protein